MERSLNEKFDFSSFQERSQRVVDGEYAILTRYGEKLNMLLRIDDMIHKLHLLELLERLDDADKLLESRKQIVYVNTGGGGKRERERERERRIEKFPQRNPLRPFLLYFLLPLE